MPSLLPLRYSPADLKSGTQADRDFCRAQIAKLKYQGIFTPGSARGTLVYPAALGGPNWGSSALDPATNTLYTRVSSLPFRLNLLPQHPSLMDQLRAKWNKHAPSWLGGLNSDPMANVAFRPPDMGVNGVDESKMTGAPYRLQLRALLSPNGIPCGPAPFGRLVATNLNTGKQVWSAAHGHMTQGGSGSVGVAGPMVTAGGLVFVASTNDPFLRAYDASTGRNFGADGCPLLPTPRR
jgi:quinoprotein glucose dehydrogenase